jgi:hypothetical protein
MTQKQWGLAISIVMAVVAAASQGAVHFPLGIPQWVVDYIQSWATTIVSIYVIVNPFLPGDVIPIAGLNTTKEPDHA